MQSNRRGATLWLRFQDWYFSQGESQQADEIPVVLQLYILFCMLKTGTESLIFKPSAQKTCNTDFPNGALVRLTRALCFYFRKTEIPVPIRSCGSNCMFSIVAFRASIWPLFYKIALAQFAYVVSLPSHVCNFFCCAVALLPDTFSLLAMNYSQNRFSFCRVSWSKTSVIIRLSQHLGSLQSNLPN